jgi:hypothetical protein
MFAISVKDLAGGMTHIQASSLDHAKDQLSPLYHTERDCIVLFDLSTYKEVSDEVPLKNMECGIYVNSYSKQDKKMFEKFTYPSGGHTIFSFDAFMNHTYDVNTIEKELFMIIYKLPQMFEWIQDRNVSHLTLETYYITTHDWYRDIREIDEIFDTLIRLLADNTTLVHVNLSVFHLYLKTHPDQLQKLQEMLNDHPNIDIIYLTRHDQRNDKVVKLEKM